MEPVRPNLPRIVSRQRIHKGYHTAPERAGYGTVSLV
jgi:hypothetical protein